MHSEVKKCADAGDVKGLRYIFVDCLDVDPTFEKYTEDYEYCRNLAGLFDEYVELTPLVNNQRAWNQEYWEKLKTDLLKNFSVKRFQHMKDVAQIIYADKIEKIKRERDEEARRLEEERKKQLQKQSKSQSASFVTPIQSGSEKKEDMNVVEARRVEERRRKLAQEEREKEEQREAKEREDRRNAVQNSASLQKGNKSDSKKVLGIALAVVIITVIIVIIKMM